MRTERPQFGSDTKREHVIITVSIGWLVSDFFGRWGEIYGRALGPEGKLLFFRFSYFLSRNIDFYNSKFRVKKSKFEI